MVITTSVAGSRRPRACENPGSRVGSTGVLELDQGMLDTRL